MGVRPLLTSSHESEISKVLGDRTESAAKRHYEKGINEERRTVEVAAAENNDEDEVANRSQVTPDCV